MPQYEGRFVNLDKMKVVIVTARFNERITYSLRDGAISALSQHGVPESQIHQVLVPGAVEIPITLQKMITSLKPDVCIAVGCVIRGATDHYTYVSNIASHGTADLALKHNLPVINCILTVENMEQALERTGIKFSNKGYDAGIAACEMYSLLQNFS